MCSNTAQKELAMMTMRFALHFVAWLLMPTEMSNALQPYFVAASSWLLYNSAGRCRTCTYGLTYRS